mmetsp:Transcript_31403/g.43574  ORF Transcript_31403/g.43574 Transcript_31403/m.43574 type:complete len:264 (-) Transcript_31403:130-921(-)|eukprot:CAMPEP_0196580962 /NCGR_PEP_ID=MMETSP1081-20130531/31746_1 /TAXON_ID=36882 /ORGANISM="Pyramimonas amylifera, Strain CCMP720" /LENGTH=263 /DNA_ID=CAMNT_0041901021 /DNA_START=141 /DNA_END=932 /DNA_ORIENTATION=-
MSHVKVHKVGAFAHVVMCKEPVNSMNAEFWELLGATLLQLEKDPEIRGLIISSGLKREIFTSGNDIKELYMPATSSERFTRFWLAQTSFLARLYNTPLFTVAAIRGACPAGGCITALCCDVRIMTDDASSCIGLNEVALGIAVPRYWAVVMARVVGHRVAEKLLTSAAMPAAREALELGIVDAVVPKSHLMVEAEKNMKAHLKFPVNGFGVTKAALRGELAAQWLDYGAEEARLGVVDLSREEIVKALGNVIKRLSSNQKSKL